MCAKACACDRTPLGDMTASQEIYYIDLSCKNEIFNFVNIPTYFNVLLKTAAILSVASSIKKTTCMVIKQCNWYLELGFFVPCIGRYTHFK